MDTVDVLIVIAASVGALALVVATCYFCDTRARGNCLWFCGCGRRAGVDAAERSAFTRCFSCFDCSLLCYRAAYCADPCGVPYQRLRRRPDDAGALDAQQLLEAAPEVAPLPMDMRASATLLPPLSLLHV